MSTCVSTTPFKEYVFIGYFVPGTVAGTWLTSMKKKKKKRFCPCGSNILEAEG